MPKVRNAKVTDFTPDNHNANRGTERGLRALDRSLRNLGAGRSILVDKNGVIIAGNKTTDRAVDIGLEDAIVVETDGTQLVVVQRTDLDLATDSRARELAYNDNQVASLDLDWDPIVIKEDYLNGVPLDTLFSEDELADLLKAADHEHKAATMKPELEISPELHERQDYLLIAFDNEFDWNVACEKLNVHSVLCGKVGHKTIETAGVGRVIPARVLLEIIQTLEDEIATLKGTTPDA